MWDVMFWPIVACILLPWLLVYLGLHVVQRGIIFIDIAMAGLTGASSMPHIPFAQPTTGINVPKR